MGITKRDFLFGALGAAGGAAVGLATGSYLTWQWQEFRHHYADRSANRAGPRGSTERLASDFKLTGLDGKVYQLSDYRGKMPVVLNFWETWCLPCKDELPTINEFTREYNGRIATLTITTDQSRNTPRYIKENNLSSLITLIDDESIFNNYNIRGIPITFIIDTEGRIARRISGATDFMDPHGPVIQTVNSLLTESTPKLQSPRMDRRDLGRRVVSYVHNMLPQDV